ncbi:hypothetical protein, partial [Salmonella enterica]|uniref:hypothetical protein n=1 Tax=Salmonella enterica TaxID=28901 RepID=UPI000B242C2B
LVPAVQIDPSLCSVLYPPASRLFIWWSIFELSQFRTRVIFMIQGLTLPLRDATLFDMVIIIALICVGRFVGRQCW